MITFYMKLWDDRASLIPATDGSGTVESGVWGLVIRATGNFDSSQWMFVWDGTF